MHAQPSRLAPVPRLLWLATLSACLSVVAPAVHAEPPAPAVTASPAPMPSAADGLPDERQFQDIVSRHPLWRAQQAQNRADLNHAEQRRAGPHEWTPSVLMARRHTRAETGLPSTTQSEWEATLEHGVRLPSKVAAAEQALSTQRAIGEGRQAQTWRQLSQQALSLYADWLREDRQEAVWQEQVQLLTQQTQAVSKRQKLGDAARIDHLQVQAALSQAQLQARSAAQRKVARWQALQTGFPGWPQTVPTASTPEQRPLTALASDDVNELITRQPETRVGQLEVEQAQTLARLDGLERTPDPIVGLKLGQARDSQERLVGVTLTWPLGSTARRYTAQSSAAQAEAAVLRQEQARHLIQQDLTLARQELQDSHQRWQLAFEAQQQLKQVAQSMGKGFELGEGQLSELLQARRLANEQALVSAQAEIDHLLARWRWQVLTGERWPAPVNP